MLRKLMVCFVLAGFSPFESAVAQQIIARPMPFFHELPSNEIWDVGQDREGYIWICTTDGLARYDGYKLQFFRSDHRQPDLLTDNSVVCISDNGRYVWIGTNGGLNLFDKETCRIAPFPAPVLQDKGIIDMVVDGSGLTWVAAEGKLYKCTADLRILREYPMRDPDGGEGLLWINSIYVDRGDTLWVMADGSGPLKYDPRADSFTAYPSVPPAEKAFILYQDADDNYWIGTWGDGFWQFFPDREGEQCYRRRPIINARTGASEPIVYSMTQDDTFGYLWVLSFNELYALRLTPAGELEQVDIHDLLDTHMMYTRIFKDREGNLWLSSYDMAYTIFFDSSPIDNYSLPQIRETLGWDANLLALCPDSDNILWMNQDCWGLCLYDPEKDLFSHDPPDNHPARLDATILAPSAVGGMWIRNGRSGSRLMKLSRKEMRIHVDEDIALERYVEAPGDILQLQEDGGGNMWILTSTRLLVKPAGGGTRFIAMPGDMPRFSCFTFDLSGQVWAVSGDWKVYRADYSAGRVRCELVTTLSAPLDPQERIDYVCVDGGNCLWMISSLRRIFKYDMGKWRFETIELESDIQDYTVLSLLADRGSVWIATNKRIIRYDTAQNAVHNYETSDDNVVVNVFRSRVASKDGYGGLYVGGHGGFVHIGAEDPTAGREPSRPVVTDVTVDNRSLFFSAPAKGYGDASANTSRRVRLKPKTRGIRIDYSTLTYSLNPGAKVSYMLEGEDAGWVYPYDHTNSAFYNRLAKGTYQFWLRTKSGQGVWTEGKVALVVEKAPAIYETWYTRLFYLLLAGLCIYWLMRSKMRRLERRNAIRFNEELNRIKLDYFTSISHELLTPLTIISTVVDQAVIKPACDTKQTQILRSNVEKLKRLILQILDFRKVDMGRMTLNISYGNIGKSIVDICQANFSPLAAKKNIDLTLDVEPENMYGYVDFDILDKILYNLLSNAIKYTPENNQIRVVVRVVEREGSPMLVIRVDDDGIGVAPGEIDRIFTRFYTNRKNCMVESNGIGLSLTKDLATLHHGTIEVESVLGKGSCFTLKLPIDREAYSAAERLDEMLAAESEYTHPDDVETEGAITTGEEGDDRLTLLLVDDNTEFLYTMRGVFGDLYRVMTVTSVRQAWEKLNAETVDAVVCDVMMPEENGWELCRRIKTDLRFDHIPVIILTARKETGDRVSSYEAGADAYIAKPFEQKVLVARVSNLLRSYRMRQAAFRREDNIDLARLNYPRADRRFLKSLIGSIEGNLEMPDFDLERLATDMNMSKSTLHRKIKAMTNLTPFDFIRNIKMKRACMMLLDSRMNISEVAYAVGFNNPKYFTRCFKDEFGITPSEYQSRERENPDMS